MSLFSKRSTSASSGGSVLASQLSGLGISLEPQPNVPQGIGGKVGQFFANIPGDVVEMGVGLGSLAATPLHDAYTGFLDVLDKLPGGGPDPNRDYRSDELLKGLVADPKLLSEKGLAGVSPVLQDYFKEAYGFAPLQGDPVPNLSNIAHSVYENPLQTALDVYGGVSLGGRMAARSALSEVGRGVDSAFTRKMLPGTDPGSPYFLSDAARAAGERSLGGTIPRLFESAEPGVEFKSLATNPVKRAVQLKTHEFLSSPISRMPGNIAEMADEFARLPGEQEAVARQRLNALQPDFYKKIRLYEAAKKYGVERLEHEPVANWRVKSEAKRITSQAKAMGFTHRNEDMVGLERVLTDALDEEQLPQFHRAAQGLPVIENVGKPNQQLRFVYTKGRMDMAEAERWLTSPEAERLADAGFMRAGFQRLRNYIDKQRTDMANLMKAGLEPGESAEALARYQNNIEAAEHYGRLLSEKIYIDVAGEADPFARAVANTRWQWHHILMESLERGLLDGMDDVMQRTYGPTLLEKYAPRMEDGRFDITKYDFEALSGEDGFSWKQAMHQFDETNQVAPLYYPHIDARKMKLSDFTLPKGRFMEKMAGSVGQHTSYWNYVNELYLMDDPVEAMARRAAQVRRIIETQKLSQKVHETFGRKLMHATDEIASSEVLYNPKLMKQVYRNMLQMDEAINEARQVGLSEEQALGRALKEVSELMADRIKKGELRGMEEVYAIPKSVADTLESFSQYQFGNKVRVFFDGPTNMWRSAVLAFSPRWIMNNLLGNILFLKLQGGKLSDVFKDMFNIDGFRDSVDAFIEGLPEEMRDQVNSGLFSEAEQYRPSMGGATSDPGFTGTVARGGERITTSKFGKGVAKTRHRVEQWNSHLERHFRRASFLQGVDRQLMEAGMTRNVNHFWRSHDALDRLAHDGITEAQAAKAVKEMNYFLNDYRKLSSFERNVLKRFIVPFWSFYKHTAKLTLSYPFAMPERALAFRALEEVSKEMDEEMSDLPPWMTGSVPIGLGTKEGETRFLNTRGANPLEGFINTLEEPMSAFGMMSPQLKLGYEFFTGKDSLTQRPFTSPNVGGAFGSEDQYKAVYDAQGNLVGVSPEPTHVRPGLVESLVRQIPQAGLARDIASWLPYPGNDTPFEVGDRYSTGQERMVGSELASPRSLGQEIAQLLGLSTTDFNVEDYRERQLSNRQAAAVQIARALGLMEPAEPR